MVALNHKPKTTRLLFVGYLAIAVFFVAFWINDARLFEDQLQVVQSSDTSAKKMRAVADLIEVARRRTRVSHQMFLVDDVFERDELFQQLGILASEYIARSEQFKSMALSEKELAAYNRLRTHMPSVVVSIRQISELAFLETEEANQEARRIIVRELIPAQEKVIDGLVEILRSVQDDISYASAKALDDYHLGKKHRFFLTLVILLFSLGIMGWLMIHITDIENRLHAASRTDSLTGVSNRRLFDEHLEADWNRHHRTGEPLSLLLVDVDFFKQYNDSFGHHQGDQCLIKVAECISRFAQREGDLAARYGGEEFAVILPGADSDSALMLANRLREAVKAESVPQGESSDSKAVVTVSVGVATAISDEAITVDELIRRADTALYESKAAGRDRVTAHSTFTPNSQDLIKAVQKA